MVVNPRIAYGKITFTELFLVIDEIDLFLAVFIY